MTRRSTPSTAPSRASGIRGHVDHGHAGRALPAVAPVNPPAARLRRPAPSPPTPHGAAPITLPPARAAACPGRIWLTRDGRPTILGGTEAQALTCLGGPDRACPGPGATGARSRSTCAAGAWSRCGCSRRLAQREGRAARRGITRRGAAHAAGRDGHRPRHPPGDAPPGERRAGSRSAPRSGRATRIHHLHARSRSRAMTRSAHSRRPSGRAACVGWIVARPAPHPPAAPAHPPPSSARRPTARPRS